MTHKNLGVMIFCSLLLSSCGLIEKFRTPEPAAQSNENTSTANLDATAPSDDLFNMPASDATAKNENHTDAPSNLFNDEPAKKDPVAENEAKNTDELQQLKSEFTGSSPRESEVTEVKPASTDSMPESVAKNSAPLKVRETTPEIKPDAEDAKVSSISSSGATKTYKVQKGETLMQIAFKLYGDISKWKELKKLNGDKLGSNSSLKSNLTLKYIEPETPFVWNPEGNPYMIKNGETLGIISKNVYHTPTKWKAIWENNKPMIKNPNVIYAGFTLYYKGSELANYVQPKKEQIKTAKSKQVEEIKVENVLSEIERLDSAEEIREIKSATVRAPASEEDSIPTAPNPEPPTEVPVDDMPDVN